MLNNNELMQAIIADTAAKVVATLDEDARKAILANAISQMLEKKDFRWEVSDIIYDEARAFTKEYIRQPEIHQQIKQKVMKATEEVMDGLAKSIAKEVQGVLKSEYRNWLKDK